MDAKSKFDHNWVRKHLLFLKELDEPRAERWLMAAFADWGIIAFVLIAAANINTVIGYFIALFIVGNRQHALAILAHEGGHGMISHKQWLNDSLACLFTFWPITVGITGYRSFHFTHHDYVNTSKDPELWSKKDKPEWDLPETKMGIFLYVLKDLLGLSFRSAWAIKKIMPPKKPMDVIGPILWWGVVGGVLLLNGLWWVVFIWFLAAPTSFLACFRLRVWTEHAGIIDAHRIDTKLWQRLIFVPHNTWYHYEHHELPFVPFWKLPQARKIYKEREVVPLSEVFDSFASAPKILSGTPLRKSNQILWRHAFSADRYEVVEYLHKQIKKAETI